MMSRQNRQYKIGGLSGVIFNIQRASLHDGPGIRTVVFIKGCPLGCPWCHNPESINTAPQIAFNSEKCISCLTCISICQHNAHHENDGVHFWDSNDCIACGACITECPVGALEMIGKYISVEEVLEEILRDKPFFNATGGGLTISGGEPMAQFAFTQEMLVRTKNEGLHTCLETCGESSWAHYNQIQENVDLFLFDIKTLDPEEHYRLTGVSNIQILNNLDRLYKSGAKLIIRCPLIPGVNDSSQDLQAIVALALKYPHLQGIEIMPYHNLGEDKAKKIGQQPRLKDIPSADKADKNRWQKFFEKNFIKVTIN